MSRSPLRNLLIAPLAGAALAGCSHAPVTVSPDTPPPDTSSQSSAPVTLDLTQPLAYSYTEDSSNSDEPLSVAKQFSRSAGGSWVVLAPKPLDDVKRPANESRYGGSGKSVKDSMEGMKKAGTPMAWDTSKGYMLLDFAGEDDLARIKAQPPVQTVGLFLRAPDDTAMLKAFADFEKITIAPDAALLRQRAAFRAIRDMNDPDDADADTNDNPISSYARIVAGNPKKSVPEFTVVGKFYLPDLMQKLGEYYGGEFTNTSGAAWELHPYKDQAKISAELDRLKKAIDEGTEISTIDQGSFSSRQNPGSESAAEREQIEQQAIATPLNDDIKTDFDTLGMLGDPAVPVLTAYLTVDKPRAAIAAIQTLGAMPEPAAGKALTTFEAALKNPPKPGQSKAARSALQRELVRVIMKRPENQARAADILTPMATDPDATPQARISARLKLARLGDITPFETRGIVPPPPALIPQFTLTTLKSADPSAAKPDPHTVSPLARTTTKDGDDWAVFVSGEVGNPNDFWLAHGKNGQWSEFLFTGATFSQNQGYYGMGAPTPGAGSCQLSVDGDKVTISPPKNDPAAKYAQIQQQLMDPKLSPDKRTALQKQFIAMSSNVTASRTVTQTSVVTLSLAALRADTDHDGLTDTIEKRLGTDPTKADTDGDGVPDDRDQNPLSKPRAGDRARLLQMVFSALFGNDTSTTPIVVVLARPYWQEFTGSSARVLCMTTDDVTRQMAGLSGYRMLEFSGTTDPQSTILTTDGPCLFNDSRSKAEVHFFFQLDSNQSSSMGYAAALMGMGTNQDYVAIFDHPGDWKLRSLRPWKFENAIQMMVKYAQGARSIVY